MQCVTSGAMHINACWDVWNTQRPMDGFDNTERMDNSERIVFWRWIRICIKTMPLLNKGGSPVSYN